MKVKVKCDRCEKTIEGIENSLGTGGFYRRGRSHWAKYMDDGESIVCDECMSVDPRYRSDYAGWHDRGY